MKTTKLNVQSAMSRCKRFTNQHLLSSKAKGSTQQISKFNTPSEQDLYQRYLTYTVHSRARALQVLRASLKGVACLVAIVIGTALFMPIAHAPAAQRMPYKSVKLYAKELTPNKTEYSCLKKLWGKESAWNHLADNPDSTAFGIPQILGLKTKDPYKQIDLGLKYIDHRYHGDACKAWNHWLRKGWY